MHFQLVSANGLKYDGEAYEVLVPTRDGTIAILREHMPLISAGEPGILSVRKKSGDNELEHFAVYGGIVQTDGQLTRFVTDEVTTSEEVSEREAEDALKRAQALVEGAEARVALHEARNVLRHHEVRLHLAQLKSRHHR